MKMSSEKLDSKISQNIVQVLPTTSVRSGAYGWLTAGTDEIQEVPKVPIKEMAQNFRNKLCLRTVSTFSFWENIFNSFVIRRASYSSESREEQ